MKNHWTMDDAFVDDDSVRYTFDADGFIHELTVQMMKHEEAVGLNVVIRHLRKKDYTVIAPEADKEGTT